MVQVTSQEILAATPVVRPARCGWLATTPPEHPFRIGVIGADEGEARVKFKDELRAWAALRDQPDPVFPEGD